MKTQLLTLAFICCSALAMGQSAPGLIAHWDMNGTTNDVSGGGHDGHGNNITPAAGMDGVAGHAWHFNGANSCISIPASPAFNVVNYTIAAKVNVQGFNAGACHLNTIFMRGRTSGVGGGDWYQLSFSDAAAGYGCTPAIDSTLESFDSYGWSATGGLAPASLSSFDYTPHIVKNTWYNVVATFDDTVYKLYVNNVLKSTAYNPSPGVLLGTGTDSAYIGLDLMEVSAGYPYPFKGDIDDILFYDRKLTDTEVTHLYDTCGAITVQPVPSTVKVGDTSVYAVTTTIFGAVYQWQQDAGSGFVNLSNTAPYSGVFTDTLTISGVTAAAAHYSYRCLVSSYSGCADTSVAASLTVLPLGINEQSFSNTVSIYPNPASKALTITAKQPITNVVISNLLGQVVKNVAPGANAVKIDISDLAPGIYQLRINGSVVKKIEVINR